MSYQLTGNDNVPLTALTLTTAYGSEGDWIISENDGKHRLFLNVLKYYFNIS